MIDVKLIHGDCLVEMQAIPDHSVDLILCDLPYGTTQCKWDVVIPFEPLWEQYWRILKPNGTVVLFGSEPFSSYLRMSQIKYYKYDWIWEKDRPSGFALANKQPMKYHEMIHIFYKEQPVYNKQMIERTGSGKDRNKYSTNHSSCKGEHTPINHKLGTVQYDPECKNPSTILKFSKGRAQDFIHPTQKPVALLEYLIKTYTNEGETVLDNCMGSGSTGVACINTNHNFIGIEKDEKYFQIAKERIEQVYNG